jgi:hypothetical protein
MARHLKSRHIIGDEIERTIHIIFISETKKKMLKPIGKFLGEKKNRIGELRIK